MLGNLRSKRKLANGGCRLKIERLEIHRFRLSSPDHLDDACKRLALRQIARPRLMHERAKGVVDLNRIDPQVDVRRTKPRRLQQA